MPAKQPDPILTDASGQPFSRPCRDDYATDVAFARAFWAYKDAITACANASFDDAFRKSMREVK